MSNSWFEFRQFRIDQEGCAMKVSTDACIQGAWTPVPDSARRALDVGTGTGLLSLMLAQRAPQLQIDAVELDGTAAAQATANVHRSPFTDRICVLEEDARTFGEPAGYDLIICNPPFFTDSLLGPRQARNQARHNVTLQQQDLMQLLKRTLRPAGLVSVMWPVPEALTWENLLADARFYCVFRLTVKDRADGRTTRIISCCSRAKPESCHEELLVIREPDGRYTDRFRELLSPFYLRL